MVKGKSRVCPKCGRSFKTVLALNQHDRASHSNSGPARGSVRTRAGSFRANSMSTQTLSGTDVLLRQTIHGGAQAGSGFVRCAIAPQAMVNTRLSAHSRLWARWRPVKLGIRVVMAGASTTFGSFAMGWSPEVDFASSKPNDLTATRVSSLKPSVAVKFWETRVFGIPCETSRKWYHTVGTSDEASHGCLVGCVESAAGGFTGVVGVTVHLDWTVQFEGIELESQGAGVESEIQPDSGWKHLFTTSDSSWDSSRLTFKMTSGGAMVPFSSAKENHIYTTKVGTKVPYVKEDKTTGTALWFVVIQGFSTPGLALCATKSDAQDYVRTGDINKLLPYVGPGAWVTPDVPEFVGVPAALGVFREDDRDEIINQLREKVALLESFQEN